MKFCKLYPEPYICGYYRNKCVVTCGCFCCCCCCLFDDVKFLLDLSQNEKRAAHFFMSFLSFRSSIKCQISSQQHPNLVMLFPLLTTPLGLLACRGAWSRRGCHEVCKIYVVCICLWILSTQLLSRRRIFGMHKKTSWNCVGE